MQECVRFLAAFLRLEKIRFVKKLRVDLCLVDEVGNLNGMGGFDLDLFEILIAQCNPLPFFVLKPFDDLIRWDFFLIGFGDFLVADRAQIRGSQLPKTDFLFFGSRINRNRNVNETKVDAALPDRTHKANTVSYSRARCQD